MGDITISVLEAKNLIAADLNGLSDPYIVIKLLKQRCRTKTIDRTLNPSWNESFKVTALSLDDVIKFECMDADLIGSDDQIGNTQITVSSLRGGVNDMWLDLQNVQHGSIHLSIQFSCTAPPAPELQIFGANVNQLCKSSVKRVPDVVHDAILHISTHGLSEEGIFRVNGSVMKIKDFKSNYDRGLQVILDESVDVATVAGLLKQYIRDLPEQIIPEVSAKTQMVDLTSYFQQDLVPSKVLAANLFRLLRAVSNNEHETKMSNTNLAIVFCPSLRCSQSTFLLLLENPQIFDNSLIIRSMHGLARGASALGPIV